MLAQFEEVGLVPLATLKKEVSMFMWVEAKEGNL
jgi:hypothetical protein